MLSNLCWLHLPTSLKQCWMISSKKWQMQSTHNLKKTGGNLIHVGEDPKDQIHQGQIHQGKVHFGIRMESLAPAEQSHVWVQTQLNQSSCLTKRKRKWQEHRLLSPTCLKNLKNKTSLLMDQNQPVLKVVERLNPKMKLLRNGSIRLNYLEAILKEMTNVLKARLK